MHYTHDTHQLETFVGFEFIGTSEPTGSVAPAFLDL